MKAKVFIGSSSEQLDTAYAAQQNLEHYFQITVWTQGIVRFSEPVIDSLIASLDAADYAIFVFTPEDLSSIREEEAKAVRDNVIFELGLFISRLGKKRCFVLQPCDVENFHMPSDLLGFTTVSYDPDRADNNLRAALASPCTAIRNAISDLEAETTTRWYTEWRLGQSEKLYREELVLTQTHGNLIMGTQTTTDSEKSTLYKVSGYSRGGFYWLEYHKESDLGGGTILIRNATDWKLAGVVVSIDCDSTVGQMRCVWNQWVKVGREKEYQSDWQVPLGVYPIE